MNYTKDEMLKRVAAAANDMSTFYKQAFINYRGANEDGESYTELISEWLLDHIDVFSRIPQITRESSYRTPGHDGNADNSESNRIEEMIAMELYRQGEVSGLGRILDYQTPLKNKRADEAGKVDLLSFDGSTIRILELKKQDSSETMLRCVLEGYTYLKTLNTDKLRCDFDLPQNVPVVANPLVFANGKQAKEMENGCPNLVSLMNILDVRPLYLSKDQNGYRVRDSFSFRNEVG